MSKPDSQTETAPVSKPKLTVLHSWEKKDNDTVQYRNRHIYELGQPNHRYDSLDIKPDMRLYVGDVKFLLPEDGKMYKKREALYHISKTVRQSSERTAMISFMVDKGYVPVTSKCLRELIRRTEEKNLPVGDDEWSGPGRPTREASAKKSIDGIVLKGNLHNRNSNLWVQDEDIFNSMNFYARECRNKNQREKEKKKKTVLLDYPSHGTKPALWDKTAWKGSIHLTGLCPVRMNVHTGAILFQDLSPPIECRSRPFISESGSTIDICSYIGSNTYDESRDGRDSKISPPETKTQTCRLYFCPRKYPPPVDANKGACSKVFKELRNKIRKESKASGSPVVCNGGGKNKRRFICAHNKRKTRAPKQDIDDKVSGVSNFIQKPKTYCNFQFEIQWDEHGYYIQLLTHRLVLNCSGCPWHTSH